MKKYIGVKIVQAEPEAKDGVQGYKVIYSEPDKPDYASWCPADVFERHNRPSNVLPFSLALEALKKGEKIKRSGWVDVHLTYSAGVFVNGRYSQPCIIKNLGKGEYGAGWFPSQEEMFADDWLIVD